jgi:H+/Cl- antiporter ClcA
VLGILSIPAAFVGGVPGIVLGLIAIVLGILALRRVKARRADNKGMAISGLVTGILGLLIGLLVLVFFVLLVNTTADCQAEFEQTGDQAQLEQCVEDSFTN